VGDRLTDSDDQPAESADQPAKSADRPTTAAGLPAVLLCGGRGTRLGGNREKPLVEVGGRPMVARVLRALAASQVDRVVAVASPDAPATRRALREGLAADIDVQCTVLDGSGDGYVADLDVGLAAVGGPAVSVAADLPLLSGRDIDDAITAAVDADPAAAAADSAVDSVAVCVPAAVKRGLGVSVDAAFDHGDQTVAPSGVNVVGDGSDRVVVRERASLAVNVNRPSDLAVARRLAGE
jgi:adenosylcobinamide-phosphate guanylyltransferase